MLGGVQSIIVEGFLDVLAGNRERQPALTQGNDVTKLHLKAVILRWLTGSATGASPEPRTGHDKGLKLHESSTPRRGVA